MEEREQNQPSGNELDTGRSSMANQEGTNIHQPLASSRPSRVPDAPNRRRIQPVLILSGLVLVILVIVVSLSPLRNVVMSRFLTATPTATVLPGDDLFYIEFPWGSVSIDGRPIAHLPVEGKDPPLHLPVGLHQVVWSDSPFTPISCTISVPSLAAGDVCHDVDESTIQLSPGHLARLLRFNVSLAYLPPTQRQALLRQIQIALDTLSSTDVMQPGELYVQSQPNALVGVGTIVRTSQPLQATLHFLLDTDPNSNRICGQYGDACSQFGVDCHQICSSPGSNDYWEGVAIAYASWSYQKPGSKTIMQDQPDTTSTAFGTEHSVLLGLSWDGQNWHARVIVEESYSSKENMYTTTNPTCAQLMSMVAGGEQYGFAEAPPKEQMNWSFFAGSKSASGCLGLAVPQQSSATSSSHLPVAYCLYRFGVLLAANAAAHRYWPSFPVADSYEQSIAQNIAAHYDSDIQQLLAHS